jgi:hypothetical protein
MAPAVPGRSREPATQSHPRVRKNQGIPNLAPRRRTGDPPGNKVRSQGFGQVVNYHEIPDDCEAAVARLLERQQHLYRGERIFNVLLGEQALYTNFGGPDVMKAQLDWRCRGCPDSVSTSSRAPRRP